MAPKVECLHTPKCHAGGTCRARRSRENKRKIEEEEEEKNARRRESNRDQMRERREQEREYVGTVLEFDEPDPCELIRVLKDENEKLKLAAVRQENASLKERIRRRDQKLKEAETVNVKKEGGEWPAVVKRLAMSLRSVGVGAALQRPGACWGSYFLFYWGRASERSQGRRFVTGTRSRVTSWCRCC
eukprot:TRINITY_DN2502_c3_g1_i4.p2 TRINITY_DN2502_c3_g1~~TRINITY_DN2502_c3_g1_i4.p2  ORF type:complete len:187 (+),score=27.13 TRINITY_DN2502_c3_g1_i4:380-940(+)